LGRSEPPQTPLALGLAWASRVTSLALEFVLPTLAGWWLDGKLGSRPVGMIAGAAVGFLIGMLHLLQIARNAPRPPT
jgi:F0F1-type ATP synthase assembly protein I